MLLAQMLSCLDIYCVAYSSTQGNDYKFVVFRTNSTLARVKPYYVAFQEI